MADGRWTSRRLDGTYWGGPLRSDDWLIIRRSKVRQCHRRIIINQPSLYSIFDGKALGVTSQPPRMPQPLLVSGSRRRQGNRGNTVIFLGSYHGKRYIEVHGKKYIEVHSKKYSKKYIVSSTWQARRVSSVPRYW